MITSATGKGLVSSC